MAKLIYVTNMSLDGFIDCAPRSSSSTSAGSTTSSCTSGIASRSEHSEARSQDAMHPRDYDCRFAARRAAETTGLSFGAYAISQ